MLCSHRVLHTKIYKAFKRVDSYESALFYLSRFCLFDCVQYILNDIILVTVNLYVQGVWMSKAKICIVGSGWRAEYFLRVAKAHEDEFEVSYVLCRREEKAQYISDKFNVPTTLDEQDIIDANPDFIIVVVTRALGSTTALKWKEKGFCVIMETPLGDTLEQILEIKKLKNSGGKLLVAEQYRYYPTYKAIIDAVKEGMIGDPVCVNASIAHDYHGFDVIREILLEPVNARFTMRTDRYDLPVTKTGDRFNVYTDGELITKNRAKVDIHYEDGKLAFYDFDSDQYHSTIRHNTIKVTGTRGEIIDGILYYLDEENIAHKKILSEDFQYAREEKADDEYGVYTLMKLAYQVAIAEGIGDANTKDEILARWEDNFDCGLMDAYMTIMMQRQGEVIEVNEIC